MEKLNRNRREKVLLRYVVSNFKSIGHPVEFSMLPAEESMDKRFSKAVTTRAGEW